MGALDNQVGGQHYKGCRYQPVKFSADLNLNFIQGNIVKYVTRYKEKNGLQDLKKVYHYAQLGQELRPRNFALFRGTDEYIERYYTLNSLPYLEGRIVYSAVYQDWTQIIENVEQLIAQEYETVH